MRLPLPRMQWVEANVRPASEAFAHGLRDRRLRYLNPPSRSLRLAYASYIAAWVNGPATSAQLMAYPPADDQ